MSEKKLPATIIFLLFISLFSCQFESSKRIIELPEGKKAVLLDGEQAIQALTNDKKEGYFEKVSQLDIQIQMKKAFPDSMTREEIVAAYKEALAGDVMSFSSSDRDFLNKIIKDVGRMLNNISVDLLPEELKLIKVGGRYLGKNVFITREKCIVIPNYELQKKNEKVLKSILIHELFHIYSRYHPAQKEQLYELIGFHKLKTGPEQIEIPPVLAKTILLNPEGVDYHYTISLEIGDKTANFIPITSANFHQQSSRTKDYFPNLSVSFYEIAPTKSGTYRVITAPDGSSPYTFFEISKSLFEKIGSNTDYLIHPDEILAEKFSLLVIYGLSEGPMSNQAKKQSLMKNIRAIISNPN